MSIPTRARNLLLEQAVEAIVPVLGAYGGGAVGALPDVEGAIDRATSVFADRIVSRWQDWLKPRSPSDVLQFLSALTAMSTDEARQEAAAVLDRHLLDVRPEDRSFALDYVAGIPAQVKQVLVFDRASSTYHLPPDWSISSGDALRRFLPMAGELKSTWARGGAKEPQTPQLQTQPDAPRTVLPVADVVTAARPAAPPPLVRHSDLVPKLRVLLRAHWQVFWAWWLRVGLTVVLLGPSILLGALLGAGVYWAIYENPHQQAQTYPVHDGWGRQIDTEYWVKGEKVTRQKHDYFLATNSNHVQAMTWAVPSGILLGLLLSGGGSWLVWRWPSIAQRILNDQIQTIAETNPDEVRNWGGVAVLRQRALVSEILNLEQKGRG